VVSAPGLNGLLTADQVREMKPAWDSDAAVAVINTLLHAAAEKCRYVDIPRSVLPDGEWASWACGRPGDNAKKLIAALMSAGFGITVDGGGHHGGGFVRISW
jgi:hypothetical protein